MGIDVFWGYIYNFFFSLFKVSVSITFLTCFPKGSISWSLLCLVVSPWNYQYSPTFVWNWQVPRRA